MLRKIKDLKGYTLDAKDTVPEEKTIGRVKDVLFDGENWVLRHLVVDTGNWLPGRKVLIPLRIAGVPDLDDDRIPIDRTKAEIKNAPPVTADEPVSRQKEKSLHEHFGLPLYWTPAALGAAMPPPAPLKRDTPEDLEGDPHLRSANEVAGYHVHAKDGDIGHVEDLLVDDDNWHIRYVIVDTRNWLPGRKVLLSIEWFDKISWADRRVYTDLTQEQIKSSPEWDPEKEVGRPYEEVLYDHYGELRYWD